MVGSPSIPCRPEETNRAQSMWFEDDRFWRFFGVAAFCTERWTEAAQSVPDLLILLGFKENSGRVLDLCCGPGRHSIPLAAAGLQVTGVDRSEYYLRQLRERAAAEHINVETVRCDMREFNRTLAFDGALCIGLSFGYLEHEDQDLAVLRNIYASLRPGARLVLDAPTPAWPLELEPWFLVKRPDFGALVEVERSTGDASVVMRWSFTGKEPGTEPSLFTQRLYAPEGLRRLFEAAGFESVRIYGGIDRRHLGKHARKAVIVGVVPKHCSKESH
jgi:SAM-dependent methyltransferase